MMDARSARAGPLQRVLGSPALGLVIIERLKLILSLDSTLDVSNAFARMFNPKDFGTVLQFFVNRKKARESLIPPDADAPRVIPRFTSVRKASTVNRLLVCLVAILRFDEDRVLPGQAPAVGVQLILVVELKAFDIRGNPPAGLVAIPTWNFLSHHIASLAPIVA